ncbi:MAG: polymer-forming cytoskeletal protein [Acidobacteriota bacterium]|nr:polymer-forming cytoskeletal protein [Blastocatellia bacterium]MDW8238353.1 polymer-forming cytoskeletal protein [Acidobacteriota bacterium]
MKFRNLKAPQVRGFLDLGTEIVGDLRFSDVLHLHGRLKGGIFSEGELVIGEHGLVEGNVEVAVLTLGGTITGNVVATEKIHLLSTGRVQGDIFTPILKVDEGAMLEGVVNTIRPNEKEPSTLIREPKSSILADTNGVHTG